MKTYIIIGALLFLSCIQFAQQVDYGNMLENNEDESFIKSQVYLLFNSLNKGYLNCSESILTSNAIIKKNNNKSVLEKNFEHLNIKYIDVEINKNTALVLTQAEVFSSENESQILSDTLKLIKIDNYWKIDDLGQLTLITLSVLNYPKYNGIENIEGINLITPSISDRIFIPKPQLTSPNTFEINANLTLSQLQRQLYQIGSEIDAATYTSSVNPDNTGNTCVFTLDSKWKRIIYSKRGSNDLKSYGETSNRPIFIRPTAIEVNEFGEVFVVDNDTKKIHKLTYNYSTNTLYNASILNIPAGLLKSPFDIDYCSNGTAFNQNDDFILITDVKRKSILKFSRDGALLQEYNTYQVGSINYDICYPSRVSTNLNMIYFIDAAKNYIVAAIMYGNNLTSGIVSKLPTNYRPADIGVDQSYNIVVSDGIGVVHKFDYSGFYLCSYKNTSLPFQDTRRISNSTFSYPGYHLMDISVNDRWSYTKGAKRLLPGVDAVKIQVVDKGSYLDASCVLTDECYYYFELIKISNNTVVKSTPQTINSFGGTNVSMRIYNTEVDCGAYKIRVSVKPFHDGLYGTYGVGWKSREIQFNPLANPVISNLIQAPKPIGPNSNARFTLNLSQGDGPFTYTFSKSNFPSDWTLTSYSISINYCDVHVGTLPTSKLLAPSIAVICTVRNACDYYTVISSSISVDPNGCPTLSFEENGTLVDENPVLITSMSNPDKDVIDYYLINKLITPVNNIVSFTIHEPQTEHTWFDNISLLETRANPDETIVVNDEGQVINYKGVLPATIILNGQTDITSSLLSVDSSSVNLIPGDVLTITRTAQSIEADGDVVLVGEEPPVGQKRIASLLMNVITKEQRDMDKESIITEKIPITNFFFRPNKSTISKKLRNLPTGTIEITVNKKLTLDYFVFVSDLRTARTRVLPLVTAVHNVNGDIKSKLTGIDQNYSEMYPAERIDLSFSTTTNSGNIAYILKTVGRYETDTTYAGKPGNLAKLNEQPIIPTENKLYDNYPNPFNPSTKIKYSLKDDGKVSLKIFNSLGEEVRTLVNEIKSAGNYEAEFNASNLPSGVYIYSIQTGEFVSSKKMILLK